MTRIIIIGTFALTWGCQMETKEPEFNRSAEAIEVVLSKPVIDSSQSAQEITVGGRMESFRITQLSSRVMGQVKTLNVREGMPVKKGQTLVRIESSDLMAQKMRLLANLDEAKAALNHASINYRRFNNLFEQSSATSFELEQAQLQHDISKSRVQQVEYSLSQLEVLIKEANVVSPMDGIVTGVVTEVGMMANPGMPLLTLETTGQLVLKVLIPESEIQFIDLKQKVGIEIPASGKKFDSRIIGFNPSAQASGSQYEFEIEIPNSVDESKSFKPGMYAHATFKIEHKPTEKLKPSAFFTVPKTAMVERGQLIGIYTVSSESKAVLRWIRTGKDMGDRVEVLSGLKPSEPYVLEADSRLFNGALVTVK